MEIKHFCLPVKLPIKITITTIKMTFLCLSSERKFQFTGSCENILQVIVNILGRFTLILLEVSNSLKKIYVRDVRDVRDTIKLNLLNYLIKGKSFNILYLYKVLPYK